MNKGRRQEIKKRKYIKRLKTLGLLNEFPEARISPKGKHNGIPFNFTGYVTTGKPCSCYVCSKHKKYNRAKNKFKNEE